MSLREYLINSIIEEKEIVTELLYIDNKVQHTFNNYEELLKKIHSIEIVNSFNNSLSYNAITDGEIETVFKVLISVNNLDTLYIERNSLGINKYLVNRTNQYYKMEKIKLDITTNYQKYQTSHLPIIISGFDTFIEELSNDFKDKEIIII